MPRASATCRCPRCKKRFKVLADEYGDHPCPRCGCGPDRVPHRKPKCHYCEGTDTVHQIAGFWFCFDCLPRAREKGASYWTRMAEAQI